MKKAQTGLRPVIIVFALQILFIVVITINRLLVMNNILPDNQLNNTDAILLLSVIIMLLAVTVLFVEYQLVNRLIKQTVTLEEMMENTRNLNSQMRAQRHDFLNHIQIVYSLVEMKEYSEVAEYLEKVYGSIEKLNSFIKTSDAAVNALLQAKSNSAKAKDIDFRLKISSNLEGVNIPSWELCRIIGNLVDNAIYAAEYYDGEKQITVEISNSLSGFELIVSNTGVPIHEKNIKKIFDESFSTKGKQGEGLGLYIVSGILKRYNGSVSVESSAEITVFRCQMNRV